jgi:hypothetical protein
MEPGDKFGDRRLFLYALVPSAIELFFCCIAALIIVCLEFTQYTGANSALSVILHGDGANVWSLQVFDTIRTILIAIAGVAVVAILIYLVVNFATRKSVATKETGSQPVTPNVPIRRSSVGPLDNRWVWRIVIAVIVLAFTLFVLPLIYNNLLSGVDFYMVSTANIVVHMGLIAAIWVVIIHAYVVFARLFMMRVRLFGTFYE